MAPILVLGMKKFIKIKYTDGYERIRKIIPQHDFTYEFKRDEWVDVPLNIALILLKDHHFISEEDMLFSPTIFNAAGLNIGIKRFGAFGDLIQLIPIIKHLRKISNNKYTLITNKSYVNDMKDFGIFHDVIVSGSDLSKFDKVIYLDGVAEKDHSLTNHQRFMHRVKIFEEFLNICVSEYDFDVKINESERKIVYEVLNNAIALQQNKDNSINIQNGNSLPNGDKPKNDCQFKWIQGLSETRF